MLKLLNAIWETEIGPSKRTEPGRTSAVCGAAARKAVMLVLADMADMNGVAWPKVTTLMARTELSEAVIRKAIGTLEEDGWISREMRYEKGRQTSSNYTIHNIDLICQPLGPRGEGVSHRGGDPLAPRGTTRTTNEPSEGTKRTGAGRRQDRAAGKMASRASEIDHDDDAPALGASPVKKSTAERKEQAESTGTTPFGLALRMKRQLVAAGYSAPVNERALTRNLKQWNLPIETLTAMVELFVANPTRYLKGDEVPWIGFSRQREVLKADALKSTRWATPDTTDPLANRGKIVDLSEDER